MTSPASAKTLRQAFTLAEMLVVIGIILVLMAIALPMILRAISVADKARTASDLQAISVALEAYKQDFQTYPEINADSIGFAVLGKALLAPGPAGSSFVYPFLPAPYSAGTTYRLGEVVQDTTAKITYVFVNPTPTLGQPVTNTLYWQPLGYGDGADGPGFRIRAGNRPYGPYLSVDRFKLRGFAILDHNNAPVLYYAANPNHVNFKAGSNYVNTTSTCLYYTGFNQSLAINDMRALLGDTDLDGMIDNGETAVATGAYVLWASGQDTKYGPADNTSKSSIAKCDDVIFSPN